MRFDAANDPLGIGVMARGRATRQAHEMQNLGHNMGPLSDPRWDGFFQAMQEQGVDRVADNSVGVARGMFGAQPATSTYDPSFQSSALQGLDQVVGVRKSPTRGPQRVQTQRGTTGLNQSQRGR